jgi:hypothetical protein
LCASPGEPAAAAEALTTLEARLLAAVDHDTLPEGLAVRAWYSVALTRASRLAPRRRAAKSAGARGADWPPWPGDSLGFSPPSHKNRAPIS